MFDFVSDEESDLNENEHQKTRPTKRSKVESQITKLEDVLDCEKGQQNFDCSISYIYSPYYTQLCSQLPIDKGRSSMVHSLIKSYGLFDKMRILAPTPATFGDLTEFHGRDYIRHLKKGPPLPQLSQNSDSDSNSSSESEEDTTGSLIHINCKEDKEDLNADFGLQDDCPLFPGVYDYVCLTAGGSLQAAKEICEGTSKVVVHWDGGRHHAKRDEAAGFCYDIDIHHGDGVEDAFLYDSSVLTLSFHKHGPGYFPGTGSIGSVGKGKGKYTSVNVPLQDGMDDKTYVRIFQKVSNEVKSKFDPQVIVMQCGADGLCHDPLGVFNLSHKAFGECLQLVQSWKLPLIVLGGGGYNNADTSRCWAYLTGLLTGTELSNNIPEHPHFRKYGPSFQLHVEEGTRPNKNAANDVENVLKSVLENVNKIGEEEEESDQSSDSDSASDSNSN